MTYFDQVEVLLTEASIFRDMMLEVKRQAEQLPLVLKAEHFKMGQAPIPDVISQGFSHPTEEEARISQSLSDEL